ncbi:vacuolar protein sorting-associated protein 51 homolog [Hetaerina americana]|uniref:vacuolar protein sorting-associated protein 51 homolog n=1 Tax=Hetaerina americana TaxID=62018 RepID=UPI003A7F48AF
MADANISPYDIDGQGFKPDDYFQKLLKECSLKQIMDKENEIIKDTQALHSEMQTLVYENYNKFILATDTIRKMKSDFKQMEDEMELLAANMESITVFSEQISSTLQDTRQKITKLSGVHSLLKKLQFLFRLPSQLKTKIEEGNYSQAVRDYTRAQRVLEAYGDTPSFQGIQKDCHDILEELREKLRAQFNSREASARELTESVELLLRLGEPSEVLRSKFLSHATLRLHDQLSLLHQRLDLGDQDIIEFVDMGSSGFLSDICLVVASYNDIFLHKSKGDAENNSESKNAAAMLQLGAFVREHMESYFLVIQKRVKLEQMDNDGATVGPRGGALLVRALDRFHRRLQAIDTLFALEKDLARSGMEVVLEAGHRQCSSHLEALKTHFREALTQVRLGLVAPPSPGIVSEENSQHGTGMLGISLQDLLTSLISSIVGKTRSALQDLLAFLQADLSFGLKPGFRESFCIKGVREGLVVGFLEHISSVSASLCAAQPKGGNPLPPPPLLLILSKLCLELAGSSVHVLMSEAEEFFAIDGKVTSENLTSEADVCNKFRSVAQQLLNNYVRSQGLAISQMLRKSVETRDWLHSLEPRTVRAVMKRVVEDVANVEAQVGALYEEGQRTKRGSDSSRRTYSVGAGRLRPGARTTPWSGAPSQLDSSLAPNLQRLFYKRVDAFSPAEFSKVSVLTGVIKISLETFLECVRLRTFGRYGLQQIQVDARYLELYICRFVEDERLVYFLLDEILRSAIHRCLDHVLMEPSVVDSICERG